MLQNKYDKFELSMHARRIKLTNTRLTIEFQNILQLGKIYTLFGNYFANHQSRVCLRRRRLLYSLLSLSPRISLITFIVVHVYTRPQTLLYAPLPISLLVSLLSLFPSLFIVTRSLQLLVHLKHKTPDFVALHYSCLSLSPRISLITPF